MLSSSRKGSAVLAVVLWMTGCSRCYLKPDERVNFYPSYAYPAADSKNWNLVLRGQVVKDNPHSLFSDASLKALNTLAMLIPDVGTRMLAIEERLHPFAVQGQPDKEVPIDWKGQARPLSKSGPDGYFEDTLAVPAQASSAEPSWIDYGTAACRDDSRRFTGQALFIPDTGISVVSEIEGTLEETHQDSNSLLALLAAQSPVPGMANVYTGWAGQGAVLHYVSANPWQWSSSIESFLGNHGFPRGTLHLNRLSLDQATTSITAALTMLTSLLQPSAAHTAPVVEELLQRFPHRRFILVGNARSQDASVFADLARRHPQQVQAIYMRRPSGATETSGSDLFQGIPAERWKIFDKAADLPSKLPA
jgi:hypothetical protein